MIGIQSSDRVGQKLHKFLLPAITIITLAVFSPVAWHDFVNYDDDVFVYANANIKDGLTLQGIKWAFTTAHEVNWIPLTWITHMLDIQFFGLNPSGHHIVNVLLHTASSAILYLFLSRATRSPLKSAFVSCLFALHPLHVESVAWIAERKDVLSAFWGMLTLYAYCCYSEKPTASRYFLTLLMYILGLLSKPMLVTMPVVLLLLDWWPLRRKTIIDEDGSGIRYSGMMRLLLEKLPFFVLSAGSSVVTYLVQQAEGELFQGYTLVARVGKACIYYVTYLFKMVWPVKLAVLYPFPKYPPTTEKILFSLVVLLLISMFVIHFRKKSPYLVTGWGWYLVTLLPVIGIIQIGQHSVADRYTYIPLTGVFMMVSWGIPQAIEKWKFRGVILLSVSAVCLVVLIVLTSLQLRHWKNGLTLFSHTTTVTKDNWVALNNLGLIYLYGGDIETAISYFNQSINAKPSYALAYQNLGAAYMELQKYETAVEAFTWALRFSPSNQQVLYALGRAYLAKGDSIRAMEKYQELLNLNSPFVPMFQEALRLFESDTSR